MDQTNERDVSYFGLNFGGVFYEGLCIIQKQKTFSLLFFNLA